MLERSFTCPNHLTSSTHMPHLLFRFIFRRPPWCQLSAGKQAITNISLPQIALCCRRTAFLWRICPLSAREPSIHETKKQKHKKNAGDPAVRFTSLARHVTKASASTRTLVSCGSRRTYYAAGTASLRALFSDRSTDSTRPK